MCIFNVILMFTARPESPTWPACAPDELSNHRYWNATKGVGFFINHTDYGHADFQDPIMTDMNLVITALIINLKTLLKRHFSNSNTGHQFLRHFRPRPRL